MHRDEKPALSRVARADRPRDRGPANEVSLKNLCFILTCTRRMAMKHSGVPPMDFRGRSQSRRVPCRKISIPLRIIGNPGGIVKRTAGRDNSVGVGRGFRIRGGMAPWPSARAHFRRAARGVTKEE